MKKSFSKVITLALTAMLVLGGLGLNPLTAQAVKKAAGDNYIKNGNFADATNLAVWNHQQGGASITSETAAEPIFGDVKTYGKITGRSSNYECFAQDLTNVVKLDTEYQYTFYVKLDENDYANAPAEQRTVEISPYFTINGKTTYSSGVNGQVSQVLTPGVWTKFTGTLDTSYGGTPSEIVVRLLEQGTNYGSGPGVMGTYYVTGVELLEMVEVEELFPIEYDIPKLRDAVTDRLGDDFIVGGAVTGSEIQDQGVKALLTNHMNAITLGNELKPDALFNYSNNSCPGRETVILNGEELEVPTLNYSRAEKILNIILKWNEAHPDQQIKVRGHVLVWHSQTPEWFFHEDYDAKKPYVTPEVMNKRLEWYIKTVCEHFTGPDSKYKGMFYGWDVVNEAVSDGTGTYRNKAENSSWWAVYESNEFIINAFRYANKYMDPSVELYYNDYNEWHASKTGGIVRLLTDVKNAEGTRIDGMGMQGHYQTGATPSVAEFETAARAYAEVVGKVQITEWDLKATSKYDGTINTKDAEYSRQAFRYLELYEVIQKLADEGIFEGMTFWGNIDKYSWLQSKNTVGGAADGLSAQCPLLFDNSYMVKPAYWAFVDPSKIPAIIQKVDIKQQVEADSYSKGERLSIEGSGTTVRFIPMFNADGFTMKVTVEDLKKQDTDGITVYFSEDGVNIQKQEIKRADATDLSGAYQTIVNFPMDKASLKNDATIYFDLVVTNDTTVIAYNDQTFNQDKKVSAYAMGTLVASDEQPVVSAPETEAEGDVAETPVENDEQTSTAKEGSAATILIVGFAVAIVLVVVVLLVIAGIKRKKSK